MDTTQPFYELQTINVIFPSLVGLNKELNGLYMAPGP